MRGLPVESNAARPAPGDRAHERHDVVARVDEPLRLEAPLFPDLLGHGDPALQPLLAPEDLLALRIDGRQAQLEVVAEVSRKEVIQRARLRLPKLREQS